MSERWQGELTKLRRAELPEGLWSRAQEGSRMAGLPPRDPAPRWVGVAAVLVIALVVGLVWSRIGPAGDGAPLSGPDVVDVPARGQVAPVFTLDGRPVFVVHHEDGTVGVVDGFSSHHPWGFDDLNVWCPSTRRFVEGAHLAQFDESGTWVDGGPAPFGLVTYDVEVVTRDAGGNPETIKIGAANEPDAARSASETDPATYPPFCPGLDEGSTQLIGHTFEDEDVFDTPADAVRAMPAGYVAARGTLMVNLPDGDPTAEPSEPWARLCASIENGECVDGAPVVNLDIIGLELNVLRPNPGSAYEEPQIWITRVRSGVLTGLAGVYPEDLNSIPR
jgi:hypothetical protein